ERLLFEPTRFNFPQRERRLKRRRQIARPSAIPHPRTKDPIAHPRFSSTPCPPRIAHFPLQPPTCYLPTPAAKGSAPVAAYKSRERPGTSPANARGKYDSSCMPSSALPNPRIAPPPSAHEKLSSRQYAPGDKSASPNNCAALAHSASSTLYHIARRDCVALPALRPAALARVHLASRAHNRTTPTARK